MTLWLWIIFAVVVAALVVVDLGLVTRRPRIVTPVEAVWSFLLWVLAAAAFSVGVFYVYEKNFLNLPDEFAFPIDGKIVDLDGHTAWLQYVTAYFLELALSLDNLAVLALLMAFFKVPRPVLARALFWSLLLTLVIRLLAVASCAWFLRELPWFRWVLGGILLMAMIRVLVLPDKATNFDQRWYVRAMRRMIPFTPNFDGQRLFTRVDGKVRGTPILLVVLIAGMLDIFFAADSIPALFSVTTDPTLAFTASALAILGLRSMYFALTEIVGRFRYLRISVVFILLFVTAKTFISQVHVQRAIGSKDAVNWFPLAVVCGIMLLGIVASAVHNRIMRRDEPLTDPRPTPLEDLGEAVDITRRNFRKVLVLIAGTFVLLVVAPIVGLIPGPGGLIVAAAGLGILATEFVWARKLLVQIKEKSQKLTEKTVKNTPIWAVPVVVCVYAAMVGAATHFAPYNLFGWKIGFGKVLVICVGTSVPVVYWAWRAVANWLQGRKNAGNAGVVSETDKGS